MKNKKALTVTLALSSLALFLSGCVQTKNGKPYGFIYDYLAKPGQVVMQWMAHLFGNNYGWAIIGLTVLVRLVLLPMMVNQQRKSTYQQEKMAAVQPEMKKIQAAQKAATTQEEKAAVSNQMMQLYKDNGISMTGGIGCLPLLIQLPVFSALYYAIRYLPELSKAQFMGITLGKSSFLLAALAFVSYVGQGYLSMIGLPQEQKKTMRTMLIVSPVMIFFVSMSAPAGLGLYFFVGGLFACLQTLIINFFRPRIRREVEAELKKHPIKPVMPAASATAKPVQATEQPADDDAATPRNARPTGGRNAGKQQRHRN
ncbi:membrane protein insertase YidC [Lactiplantibacillus mudanjiangensis]|uniref:Membrane protein insertase YidC n=1 Tax=Lactiplantibacillus mudanjiangensis TaxID=1296538 RepID=A0A660E1Z6_9LACO|nr:membrane protein insertase YidC [Lactiplantibacillus mudanjiangensis]VDG19866.1 OxaA precursor [Lactobacillus sp.] [Lactiplantibacillus mudanjiangensis]VDG25779.1 OxaA precursor [Lactobacillus sp.] [Lactiplantibacillus mudanjiangensis]VDG29748.1 OxaA precursor [Lactobacillus sp.] [Lactiplantibacillus mudanjiangensis]VDG31289.1 OxaA precursor [Lactobacillus sp.] [Lactiplantibacillus mudanjiangensis]